ncbi:MAG: ATP-dependent Clp protease proteolytic subunit 1 [Chlamydiales bacterium]|nr:ATP-dependent Clp protease proteolytic subunit 1 [Chlamydiales bacterium]MCH9635932.1 ATP-dependent Clp protease proteolytic subunit 1 [Chlamydiales bacterium]MCH9704243.1 ATP-dependent Clp protease proteolytic subunit [Chlamydiota bacterium]
MPEQVETFKSLRDKIDSTILESRRILFGDAVDQNSAKEAIRQLWYLEMKDPGKPITFVICSPGGSVDAGFAVWDQVKMITSPVYTLVTGLAASMGSVLSLCAAPGKRFATKHARIMIHQPSIGGPITGQATDLEIQAKEILKTKGQLVDLYCEHTGKERKEIERALDRDTWMTADEAKSFGLLDGIVDSFADIK